MLRFNSSIPLVLALVAGAYSPDPPATVPTPSNPEERIALAQRVNGLHGLKQPWHVKASYEWLGLDGVVKEKGTYEEWWVDEKQYRIAIDRPANPIEEYGSDRGVFRTHADASLRSPLNKIHSLVATPVLFAPGLGHMEFKNHERDFGAGNMPCTLVIHPGSNGQRPGGIDHCFALYDAVLFYKSDDTQTFQSRFQNFMQVRGQYLARDTQLFVGGDSWLKVHIDTVLSLTPKDIIAMNPPASAQRVAMPMEASLGVTVTPGRVLFRVGPDYPSIAKSRHIQGTVILSCMVDRKGHPQDIWILAGPPLLREAAVDAASQWVWDPPQWQGEPIEIETTVVMNFDLPR